jgi:hypothetical protein
LNPAYVWGAASLLPGAPGDCSGKIYAILASCGVPVQRITSRMIASGFDGWNFPKAAYTDIKRLALYFMTLTSDRPEGHMGMISAVLLPEGKSRQYVLAHESTSAGFITTPVKVGYWTYRSFSKARNIK